LTTTSRPHFSHLGLCTLDLAAMENFYTDVLGMTVTDRGEAAGMQLVFLSGDPNEHHQIVLSTGRPRGLPQNEQNPMFGPVVNQVSFRLDDLAALREMHRRVATRGIDQILPGNHGISISLYFPDPEGNLIECFVETEWYCEQPILEVFDLDSSDEEILARAEQICRGGNRFMKAQDWKAGMAATMA
jgi:catechol-2,3-dioxygenase